MATVSITSGDLRGALPNTSKDVCIGGLDGAVDIYRDARGIPHVRAGSVHDAFFGQAFATAQDRLWHMDYDRRRAYGRWAEYAGESAVEQDVTMRRFQIGPTVEADYAAISGEARAMLEAYAAGVNAFIETTQALPIEYNLVGGRPEPWRPWDCLAVYKVRHIMMGVFETKLWRARLVNALGPERAAELLRGYQPDYLLIVPPGVPYDGPVLDGLEELERGLGNIDWMRETDAGSNSWAVAGSRTASGKPLMAGDPHRGLDTPNVYYQNHVACPEFDVIGLSFPGCPGFPHFGHNAHVAWCVTHAGADYQDLYVERFDRDDPPRYELKGDWKRADIRRETVVVRDGESVDLEVAVTGHGPIIAGEPSSGYGIAFKYTSTAEANHGPESILGMLTSRSADEMDESMRNWVDPCNNFLFADVDGNIGYLNRGQVPVRSMANAWLPVPGWTGEHEWEGLIPFEDLARLRNPDTGYIVTANNRIVGDDYPYYIALDSAPEYRARRITERLKAIEGATVADMGSVHAERVSIPARIYSELLAEIEPMDEMSGRAKDRLAGWDGSMDADAVAPTIYSAFRRMLHRHVYGHLLGPLAGDALGATGRGAPGHLRGLDSLLVTKASRGDRSMLPPGVNWKALAAQALSEAVSDLRGGLGDDMDSWRWGRVHHTRPRHTLSDAFPDLAPLLDPPSLPLGGDGDTPQAASYSPANPFVMTSTSVARYVFDTADWDNSAWITPLGASGHPGSDHYADQAPVWGELNLMPMTYSWDRITEEAASRQRLGARG